MTLFSYIHSKFQVNISIFRWSRAVFLGTVFFLTTWYLFFAKFSSRSKCWTLYAKAWQSYIILVLTSKRKSSLKILLYISTSLGCNSYFVSYKKKNSGKNLTRNGDILQLFTINHTIESFINTQWLTRLTTPAGTLTSTTEGQNTPWPQSTAGTLGPRLRHFFFVLYYVAPPSSTFLFFIMY